MGEVVRDVLHQGGEVIRDVLAGLGIGLHPGCNREAVLLAEVLHLDVRGAERGGQLTLKP